MLGLVLYEPKCTVHNCSFACLACFFPRCHSIPLLPCSLFGSHDASISIRNTQVRRRPAQTQRATATFVPVFDDELLRSRPVALLTTWLRSTHGPATVHKTSTSFKQNTHSTCSKGRVATAHLRWVWARIARPTTSSRYGRVVSVLHLTLPTFSLLL